jgi:hypothetical protein
MCKILAVSIHSVCSFQTRRAAVAQIVGVWVSSCRVTPCLGETAACGDRSAGAAAGNVTDRDAVLAADLQSY